MSQENPYAPPESDVEVDAPNETELASLWARFGGAFIDGIIGGIVVFALMFATGRMAAYTDPEQAYANAGFSTIAWLVSYLVIHGYTLATRGQSLGKIMAGTRIVSISDGRILPLWKVIGVRLVPVSLLGYIPLVGPILGLVNILLIFRNDRRCGHDLIAGTRVVKA